MDEKKLAKAIAGELVKSIFKVIGIIILGTWALGFIVFLIQVILDIFS